MLEIRTCLIPNGQQNRVVPFETTCDSLIITVQGLDFGELRFSKPFDQKLPLRTDTISRLPVGTDRTVKIVTIDRAGDIVHADTVRHTGIRIDAGGTVSLNVMLVPRVGSIYLQLEDVPSTVDSVFARFTADDNRSWGTRAKRSGKMFMSIDKIPHATRGVLSVVALNVHKDTLYRASDTFTFSACSMESIVLTFTDTPGALTMDISIALPGVTSASGSMQEPAAPAVESGELIISEIMYAANDSEYVETYNPGESRKTFDTIYLAIDGGRRLGFTNISIGARETFVIGRKILPWCDTAPSSPNALELTRTGNRITLSASGDRILDRVFFTGETNGLEWPPLSGKRSIVLDIGMNDARLNDFGRFWRVAGASIDGSGSQYGTPGTR